MQASVKLSVGDDNNPICLFSVSAFHGGIWRNAFTIDSIGAVAATSFYVKHYALHLVASGAAFSAYIAWLVKKD